MESNNPNDSEETPFDAVISEYGIGAYPHVVDILYGSEDEFIDSFDNGDTVVYDAKGRREDAACSSLVVLKRAASGRLFGVHDM